MLCTTTVVAYTSAGVGRTFGRPRIFHLMVLLGCGPLIAALMFIGGSYHFALALLSIVFFIAIRRLTSSLQRIYLNAWIAREREAALAGQFDTALNNMPHGLCMFRADGRLAVMNRRFSEMMNLSDDLVQRGASASDIVADCVGAGSISAASGNMILSEIENAQARDIITTDPDAARNRSLSWTFQPMAGGGTVVLVEDITERRNAEARISHLARYDELTALPNRVNFRDEMERLLAISHSAARLSALLFIDLDQFKQVNDTLGHPAGDALLCAVADRLRGIVRDIDFVARFGGDEFIVLETSVRDPEGVAILAGRIVEELGEPYDINGHHVVIGASVGIAVAPRDGTGADVLLKNADMALYRAKSEGRSVWRFFEPEMDVKARARRSLELDLRDAVATGAFEVYYQPLINLNTARITTCEALLRWWHPERGMISPAEFIPIAEEMGLIVEIGNWVLRRACLECAQWPGDVRVAVNLSPIQFRRGNLMRDITDALRIQEERAKASKLASLGLLAGGMARDFNNILMAVMGNVSMARAIMPRTPSSTDWLAEAEQACVRARRLTWQLLTFSKGGVPMRKTVAIGQILQESVGLALRGSGVTCALDIAPDLWSVDADVGQLAQVFNNVMLNARQAMLNSGVITIRAENVCEVDRRWENALRVEPGRYVRVSIADKGIGIPREHLNRIFDPYFSTKQGASGFGLATTYSIVKNHGGFLAVDSQLGSGTTIQINFPAAGSLELPEQSDLITRGEGSRHRVLVMDDEAPVRRLTMNMLDFLGYDAEVTHSVGAAIERFRHALASDRPFDVVMLDLFVPGDIGGTEAMDQLGAIDPAVKAILMSGFGQDPVMAEFHAYGFRAVITKPFTLQELNATLHSVIASTAWRVH